MIKIEGVPSLSAFGWSEGKDSSEIFILGGSNGEFLESGLLKIDFKEETMTEYAECPFDSQTSLSKVAVDYNEEKKGYAVHSFGGVASEGSSSYVDLMIAEPKWKMYEKAYISIFEMSDDIELIFKQNVVFK